MRKLRPLMIAVPAFAVGCLVAATLISTAQAQTKPRNTANVMAQPRYKIVYDEAAMNRFATQGYEVQSQSSMANVTSYLMKRY